MQIESGLLKGIVRVELYNLIEEAIKNPDFYYHGETEPTGKLIEYLKEHNIPVPSLDDHIIKSEDLVKLMVRAWVTIEALNSMCHIQGNK